MYPTGNATILAGATSTTFDANEVVNENPFIEFDNSINVWRTTSSSPLYENTLNIEPIEEDIEGQERPISSNPGADHYSITSIRFGPLTEEDVGPYSDEDNTTSVSLVHQKNDVLIYPVPANDILYLKNFNPNFNIIEIFNAEGKIILERKIESRDSSINVSWLTSGIYFIKFSGSRKAVDTSKIIVQH